MPNNTKLRNEIRKTIAAIENFDIKNAHLMRNVTTFSNCTPNPLADDAANYYQQRETLKNAAQNAVENAYYAGVRPSTINKLCGGELTGVDARFNYIYKLNLGVFANA